jgi:hypothetical protein
LTKDKETEPEAAENVHPLERELAFAKEAVTESEI